MRLLRLLLALPLLSPLACDDDSNDGSGSPGTTSDGGTGTDTSEQTTAGPSATSDTPTTAGSSSTTAPGSTDDTGESSTSGDAPTSDTGEVEGSTGEVPTSGPGVLPGEGGLDAFCRRFFECGGAYYSDEQDCIDASVNYWGECTEVTQALDGFGACMSEIECEDYSPDAYNPASTPCSEQWSDVQSAGPC